MDLRGAVESAQKCLPQERSGWRMEQLSRWLWKQEYWLPPGVRWADMEKMEGSRRPLPRDLLLALPLALGFIVLRYAFERWLMTLSSPEGFSCNWTRFWPQLITIWVQLQKIQPEMFRYYLSRDVSPPPTHTHIYLNDVFNCYNLNNKIYYVQ